MSQQTDDSRGTSGGMPPNTHPDGTPMSQDEIDAYWLAHIYRKGEPQSQTRSIAMGMLLGGVLSLSNLYVGLRAGWGLAVTVTAAVLAYAIFAVMRHVLPFGPFKREFSAIENNLMASTSSAAGYFTGAGLTSAIPALYMSTGFQLPPLQLAIWILAISFLGVLLAVPMRRQMIDVDRLPFPEGLAYAETIRSLHAGPSAGGKQARALLLGALAGGAAKLAGGVLGFAKPFAAALKAPLLPESFFAAATPKWTALTLGLQSDILFVGAGAMMGLRTCVGLALGAVLGFGVVAPWLHSHGLTGAKLDFAGVRPWLVWPGVAMVVVSGLLAFGLKWRTALSAFRGMGRLASGTQQGGMAEVEVPTRWFVRGLIVCTIAVVVLAKVFFNIPLWLGFIAVALSSVLSIVACRATGETSITPVGALGKITQLIMAGFSPGNVTTNLMTASVTAGAAMHSADLLTDYSGGYRLGARPRSQFASQFFGIVAGAVFCIPMYALLATPERLGSKELPAPAASVWRAVAELLSAGVASKERGSAEVVPASATGVPVAVVPASVKPGNTLLITLGNNAGEYRVLAVMNKMLVVNRPLPDAEAAKNGTEGRIVELDTRVAITGPSKALPALQAAWHRNLPADTNKGDWLRYNAGGHALYWQIKARFGNQLVLDRPWVDPREGMKLPKREAYRVDIRKESLPPYALLATLLAIVLAIGMTLVDTYAPASVKKWVPSITGFGLSWTGITGFDSISMFIGALLAWVFQKIRPKAAEKYTLTAGSGLMAGAAIAGIIIIVLGAKVAGILVTPE